jgi:hypothetical protein
MLKCRELHASILPLNQKLHGPLDHDTDGDRDPSSSFDGSTALPFVLLVGNHSSGKSSFINYVLGRTIQTAGVAPTDDAFTIIAPGPVDRDQDGPALSKYNETNRNMHIEESRQCVAFFSHTHICSPFYTHTHKVGDPDLGFQPLRQFGPTLMHHTTLKIRSNIDSNFIMVDSPGMIDSPGTTSGMLYQPQPTHPLGSHYSNHKQTSSSAPRLLDRGYDFTGVVRWMATRADVVCLFFDPDKPGTTGETLHILLHALSGMDHKLLIVLNKADQFRNNIHDFARAYGSLCWNLSKVIPRKDLPRIYTMCLPVDEQQQQQNRDETRSTTSNTTTIPSVSLQDLYTARDEVVEAVRRAPQRRMDNVITNLFDAVHQLQMHGRVVQDLQQRWSRLYWQRKWQQLAVATTGLAATMALVATTNSAGDGAVAVVPLQVTGGVMATTILVTGAMTWYHNRQIQEWNEQACSMEELSAAFQRTHAREISQGDEYMAALWQRVRDPLWMALQQRPDMGQWSAPSVAEMARLRGILQKDIPALRRLVSPTHYGKGEEDSSASLLPFQPKSGNTNDK